MKKDSLHYTYVPRKVYDRAMDKLKETNGRQKSEIKTLARRIRSIEEFLSQGPHHVAYRIWMEEKDK